MKTKKLFLTLGILFTMSAIVLADAPTLDDDFYPDDLNAEVTLTDGDYKLFAASQSNEITSSTYTGISSTASYVGKIGYDADDGYFTFDNQHVFGSYASGGYVRNISFTWASTKNSLGTSSKTSKIYIYASNSACSGTETSGSLSSWTLLATYTYDGSTFDVSHNVAGSYTHFIICGPNKRYTSYLEDITITWEPITYYTVSVNPGLEHGTIELSKTSAKSGDRVTMTITPDYGYELVSYQYGSSPTVYLSESAITSDPYEASFSMPSSDVVVTATFRETVVRDMADVYFYATVSDLESDTETDEVTVGSGSTVVVYFMTDPTYTASSISARIEDGDVAVITTTPVYDTESGEGSITIKGYKSGSTELIFEMAKTDEFDYNYGRLTITVVPQEMVLVTECDGTYYAVTTTLSTNDLAAQEVIVANGNVYYDPEGTYTSSDLIWNVEYVIVDEEELMTLSNSSGEYLATATSTRFSFRASSYSWVIEAGRLMSYHSKGFMYSRSNNVFKAISFYDSSDDLTESAYPISATNLHTFNSYDRSLTNGNYATMCLPYAVSPTFLSGIEVYRITGKSMSGSKVNGIALEEVTDVLVAGQPYVIKATASTLNAKYGEATVAVPVDDDSDGLVGNLDSSPLAVPDGCYGLSKNQLRKVNGGTATVGQYRAYIDLSEVDELGGGGASAPGRIILYAQPEENVENPDDNGNNDNNGNTGEGSEVATSLEDFLNNASPINWNEPVYNTLGQRVGKGSTGVLIQNGQKFLVK